MANKKNIKRVAAAVAKEKHEASPSITKEVLSSNDGLVQLAVPFTKKMKK